MSSRLFLWDRPYTPIFEVPLLNFAQTDIGAAEAFMHLHGREFLYIREKKHWVKFDGVRWRNADEEMEKRMLQVIRSISHTAIVHHPPGSEAARGIAKWCREYEAVGKIKNSIEGVRYYSSESLNDFDKDKWLLACDNQTIDLKTGKPHSNLPENMLLRSTGVTYKPLDDCPRWKQFLLEIFNNDTELIDYIQRAVGYTLTGDSKEQAFFLLYGSGANGKSTFLKVLEKLMGEYGIAASSSTFIEQKNESISNDVARMAGARFVKAVETKEFARFNIERMKALTGGESITARFLYAENFDFTPIAKFWMATNHLPEVRDTTTSFWRRQHEIPFEVMFPDEKQDKELDEKLFSEISGILNWAIEGCLVYREKGLQRPAAVIRATEEYRSEYDILQQFLDEKTERNIAKYTRASALYQRLAEWCEINRTHCPSRQLFGRSMKDKGFTKEEWGHDKAIVYKYITLRDE